MRAAFVQMDCHFGKVKENTEKAVELIRNNDSDLYVLPELFNSGYLFLNRKETALFAESIPDGPTAKVLIELAQEKKCYISAGLAEKDGDKIYNSSFVTGPDGYIATYRKIHLFDAEKEWFDPGNIPFFVVNVGSVKVGFMICFDWMFPESMRSLALLGADVVCHSANLVMSYCQNAMTTRCLENGLFAITANRIGDDIRPEKTLHFTGLSQITGPRGEILARASANEEQVMVVKINPYSARNKFLNFNNDLLADRRTNLYKLA